MCTSEIKRNSRIIKEKYTNKFEIIRILSEIRYKRIVGYTISEIEVLQESILPNKLINYNLEKDKLICETKRLNRIIDRKAFLISGM